MATRTQGFRSPNTRGFRNPLRLAPIRSAGSIELDGQRTSRSGLLLPRFERFDRFMDGFTWRVGEHLTIIGPTGSGKTVLARQLLRRREYTVVLGVKNRDPELYGPFQREGYELVRRFDPDPDEGQTHLLFAPRTDLKGAAGRAYRAERFREALNEVYDAGGWCVYADDIQYMSDKLRLDPEFEELWLLGRSEEVTVAVSSQEPVDIPVMAYGMATHLFMFLNRDVRRAERMADLTGVNREVVKETILSLPQHEFLYVPKYGGEMIRSKVIRETNA